MTKEEAIQIGKSEGFGAVTWCEFEYDLELDYEENLDKLIEAACVSEEASRDFSPWELIAHAINSCSNHEELWDCYNKGVSLGIAEGAKPRMAKLYKEV